MFLGERRIIFCRKRLFAVVIVGMGKGGGDFVDM